MEAVSITVVAVEEKKGVSKKSGQPYAMTVCQCVVKSGAMVNVGELVLPKDHPPVTPGEYDATFTVQVGFDKRISGVVERLTPKKALRAAGAA
jgi:hypothetical protein